MKRGTGVIEVILIIAVLGAGAWAAFPSIFSGAGRRAKASTTATAKLEDATTAKGAEVAASVATIGQANAEGPQSPSSAFISREVPYALSLLPAPDPKALIEAERRKLAVMEGRLAEATKLYETAAAKADRLTKERDEALAARQAADLALEKAAAAEHARTVQAFGAILVAVIALAAFAYVKLTGIKPTQIGSALADVAAGMPPTVALDTVLTAAQQRRIARARKLASP